MRPKHFATIILTSLLIATVFGSVTVFAPAPTPNPPTLWDAFITNTNDHPVPVTITDSVDVNLNEPIEVVNTPAFEPFHCSISTTINTGTLGSSGGVGWSAGKLIVIEYVSAVAENLDASDSLSVEISTEHSGFSIQHHLGVVGPQGRPKQFLSEEVKLYHESDKMLNFHLERLTGINDVPVEVTLSGYSIDVS